MDFSPPGKRGRLDRRSLAASCTAIIRLKYAVQLERYRRALSRQALFPLNPGRIEDFFRQHLAHRRRPARTSTTNVGLPWQQERSHRTHAFDQAERSSRGTTTGERRTNKKNGCFDKRDETQNRSGGHDAFVVLLSIVELRPSILRVPQAGAQGETERGTRRIASGGGGGRADNHDEV